MNYETETKSLEELKQEAAALGIKHNPNIGTEKLAQKIEDHYNSQAADDSVVSIDDEPLEEPVELDSVDHTSDKPVKGKVGTISKEQKLRTLVNETKRAAMKKRVVTISSNDKRDSEFTTTAYLSMENQYFGISKLVPLDIPIELEQCLIDVARSTEITLHKDEIINGRRTGNKTPVRTRKYNISYEDIKPTA